MMGEEVGVSEKINFEWLNNLNPKVRGVSMKKKICVLLVFLMFCLSLTAVSCTTTEKKVEKKVEKKEKKEASGTPYKIGAVLSLTGDYSSLGGPEKNVIEMEVEKLNKEGGIKGHPVEVKVEDDGTDATKAVTATTKLIDQEKVIAIIGTSGSGQSMAMRGEIEKAQIPDVSLAGGNAISEPVNKWVFQIPWPNGVVVPRTLDYLKKKGIKKIGLLYDSGGFGADGKKVLDAEAGKADIEIVASESYGKDDTDMSAQLTKIKGAGAKAVVVWGAGKAPAIIAKNMKQLKMDVPYIGSHGIARKSSLRELGMLRKALFLLQARSLFLRLTEREPRLLSLLRSISKSTKTSTAKSQMELFLLMPTMAFT